VSVDVDQNINVKRYPRKSYKHDAVPIDQITTGEDQEQMRLRDSHKSSMTDMCKVNTSSGGLSKLQGFPHKRSGTGSFEDQGTQWHIAIPKA